jgi:hypothetical protein
MGRHRTKRYELPTQSRLQELLNYDPETGIVTAKQPFNRRGGYNTGDVVGYPDVGGYLKVTIDKTPYALHRVIWKLVTGNEPVDYLDHKDRNRQNNRWANLREATSTQNAANMKPSALYGSGGRGVRFMPGSKRKWHVEIQANGERFKIGEFDSFEEAHEAYKADAKRRHGEFALDDRGDPRVFYEVVNLIDLEFCDTMMKAAGRLAAFRIGAKVSPEVQAALDDIGLDITTELYNLGLPRYAGIRHRK